MILPVIFFIFFWGEGGVMLNVPVNNFFSHVGMEPPLAGYYQYFFFFWGGGGGMGGKYVLLKDTTRRPSGARTTDL